MKTATDHRSIILDWAGVERYPEKDGVYANVEEDLYHGDKTRFSKHQLDTFLYSPAHWLAEYQGKREKKQTAPMAWGSALDMLVTDPTRFETVYRAGPDVSRNTTRWKDFVAGLEPGQRAIKTTELRHIVSARAAINEWPPSRECLFGAGAVTQLTVNWTWRNSDAADVMTVPMRSRLDVVRFCSSAQIIISDLKRAKDARQEAFEDAVVRYGLHLQEECYRMALRQHFGNVPIEFYFVVVEPEPPHKIGRYAVSASLAAVAAHILEVALAHYAQCCQSGDFPNGNEIGHLQGPAWYWRKIRGTEEM